MEQTVFLDRPQQLSQFFLSWNINGVKTKLEGKVVQDLLYKYDLICLNEVKKPLQVYFIGYVAYTGKSVARGSNQRGGTVLLIKNVLSSLIASVNVRIEDQICTDYIIWLLLHTSNRLTLLFAKFLLVSTRAADDRYDQQQVLCSWRSER